MPLWEEKGAAWHEVLPGVRRRILVQGEGLTFVMYRIEPGRSLPLHTHPHVQAGVFLEGGGEFRVGDETWTMKQGSSYLVASNVPHELRTDRYAPERDPRRVPARAGGLPERGRAARSSVVAPPPGDSQANTRAIAPLAPSILSGAATSV